MPTIVMIADDFTGANDTGVQFALAAGSTSVYYGTLAVAAEDAVAVFDTESRHLPAEHAAAAVAEATRAAADAGARVFYKKIDSTLRGNVGAEVRSMLAVLKTRSAVVAPAFPAGGRKTIDGRCLVHGMPVADTEFSRDPLAPVRESSVLSLFGDRVTSVGLSDVRRNVEDPIRRLADLPGTVSVFDADSDEDLDLIARAGLRFPESLVYVGSVGLAAALVRAGLVERVRVGGEEKNGAGPSACDAAADGSRGRSTGVLLVVGSLGETTRMQLREALGAGICTEVRLSAASALEEREVGGLSSRVAGTLADGKNVALCGPTNRLSRGASRVSRTLAAAVSEVFQRVVPKGLIATGGETALAVCTAIGGTRFRPGGEVQPGVPFGSLFSRYGSIALVTKAGGFGNRRALIDAVNHIRTEM